jgi:stearoyl-CoA desaturase (delta-9 desaturase)
MLTFIALDLFVFLTHKHGYQNFKTRDNSKNNWFISLILWGEGWHNNHHHNAGSHTTKIKWWEFDPLSIIIRMVAK